MGFVFTYIVFNLLIFIWYETSPYTYTSNFDNDWYIDILIAMLSFSFSKMIGINYKEDDGVFFYKKKDEGVFSNTFFFKVKTY